MGAERAFEFLASFPTDKTPWRPTKDGGVDIALEAGEESYELISALYKSGRGKVLRVLIEVQQ